MHPLYFLLTNIFLGVGLAMDAFSVSVANGMSSSKSFKRSAIISAVFSFFQFVMPIIGWLCVHNAVSHFEAFAIAAPWIACTLMVGLGIQMIVKGIKDAEAGIKPSPVSNKMLLVQGIATSIDALSVGFTINDYNFHEAIRASIIIAVVTFILCCFGVEAGRKFGSKTARKAPVIGGFILIGIGIEIVIKNYI